MTSGSKVGGNRDGSVPRRISAVVLAVGAALVVALAAGGAQVLLPPADLSEGWFVGVRVAGVVAVAAGVVGVLVQRHRLLARGVKSPDPTYVGLRTAVAIMGMVALLGLLNPPPPMERSPSSGLPSGWLDVSRWGTDRRGQGTREARTRGGESVIRGGPADIEGQTFEVERVPPPDRTLLRRAAGVLTWLLLLALVLMAARYMASKRRRPRTLEISFDPPVPRADAETGLEASLEEVGVSGSDLRAQITRAYHRLLDALTEAGAPREPQEAPHEHLHRAMTPLGVRPDALHRLAELYVFAQFGGRPVTERHREAATDALEVSLNDLRPHRASRRKERAVDGATAP